MDKKYFDIKENYGRWKKGISPVIACEINRNKNQLAIIKACEELILRGYNSQVDILGKISD